MLPLLLDRSRTATVMLQLDYDHLKSEMKLKEEKKDHSYLQQ